MRVKITYAIFNEIIMPIGQYSDILLLDINIHKENNTIPIKKELDAIYDQWKSKDYYENKEKKYANYAAMIKDIKIHIKLLLKKKEIDYLSIKVVPITDESFKGTQYKEFPEYFH